MTTCARCGHELGIGRFCLNCGHPVGEPVPADEPLLDVRDEDPLPDEDGGSALSGLPGWVAWTVGATLLIILFALLAARLNGDDEPGDDAATDAAQTTTTTPETRTQRPVNLAGSLKVSAPRAAPPTTDLDGERVAYDARRMLDNSADTAWRTAGDATGQTITFTLAEPSTIQRIGLINGYAKQVPSGTGVVDWYPNNRRITSVEWVFDDGTTINHVLSEVPKLQRLEIDPITTTTVELRLLTVTAPGAGPLGRDYTAISDILIAGTPAA